MNEQGTYYLMDISISNVVENLISHNKSAMCTVTLKCQMRIIRSTINCIKKHSIKQRRHGNGSHTLYKMSSLIIEILQVLSASAGIRIRCRDGLMSRLLWLLLRETQRISQIGSGVHFTGKSIFQIG